jgi:hypothetical protein
MPNLITHEKITIQQKYAQFARKFDALGNKHVPYYAKFDAWCLKHEGAFILAFILSTPILFKVCSFLKELFCLFYF